MDRDGCHAILKMFLDFMRSYRVWLLERRSSRGTTERLTPGWRNLDCIEESFEDSIKVGLKGEVAG